MASNALLLFATGRDRPGIVDRISRHIFEAGLNLEDSRMALLGGEFALIVLVTGGPESLRRMEEGLPAVARELDLTVHVKPTSPARSGAVGAILYRIGAVSMDHPGIVHKLTRILAEHKVNVVRLDTSLAHAPVSGTPVFSLEIEAEVPAELPIALLRTKLAEVAALENIDLEIRAVKG